MLLIDTDVLIDHLRGFGPAVTLLSSSTSPMCLSAISVAELYQGVRGGTEDREQRTLVRFLDGFEIISVSPEIARAAGLLRRGYGASHGIGLADAVMAATAHSLGARLMTLNVKHYPMFESLTPAYAK